MKLACWNINGIRAACKKGFLQWFEAESADIVSVQETKVRPEQVPDGARQPRGYHSFWHNAIKPGYSGVAVYSRIEPLSVSYGLGIPEIDREGRVIELAFSDFTLINAYFPHARRDLLRLDYKLFFLKEMMNRIQTLKVRGQAVVLCGDYNISHAEIDLANPRGNKKNAGFLPDERAWMDRFLAMGFRDVFRDRHPDRNGFYTWWSNRKGVRERNVGWRIDYHCVDESLSDRVRGVGHRDKVRGSDHCPIFIEFND